MTLLEIFDIGLVADIDWYMSIDVTYLSVCSTGEMYISATFLSTLVPKLFNFLQSKLAKLSKDRPIMATIPPIPYHIQSVNTKAFAVSTPNDKPGQEVKTNPNRDEQTVRAQLFTLAFF